MCMPVFAHPGSFKGTFKVVVMVFNGSLVLLECPKVVLRIFEGSFVAKLSSSSVEVQSNLN